MTAVRLYRNLLRLYPSSYGHHYGQQMERLFCDLYRDYQKRPTLIATWHFWCGILVDLLINAWHEGKDSMKPQSLIIPALVAVFLLVPFIFLLSSAFGYSLGIEAARWPTELLYPESASEARDNLMDMVIVLGPVVAVGILGLSLLRSWWEHRSYGLHSVLILADSHRLATGLLFLGLGSLYALWFCRDLALPDWPASAMLMQPASWEVRR